MQTEPIKEKKTRKKPLSKVDVSSALNLKLNNKLSYKQIAQIQGVSPQAIHQAIKDLLPNQETELYKNHRADIIAGLQAKILKSIDDEDIKKSPFGSRTLALCQLYDKERLERGKSTDNILAVHAIVAKIDKLEAEEKAKEGK